ncbi:MAG: hypothetical protein FJ397_09705 [Verrucomicrobia bacterium]|nr:hypothetical protein [Verrucomicrobiota bacterium]
MKYNAFRSVIGVRAPVLTLFVALLLVVSLTVAPSLAQSDGTSTITGRVIDPASGQYLRNAQVRVQNTELVAVAQEGGVYRLFGVPPGSVTLVVTYTGFHPSTVPLQLTAGSSVTQDFNLVSALRGGDTDAATVKLEKFLVAGEREGQAKAIMDQRNSMNITNAVSSDVFGDDTEGNIGHFLKNMPGVELNIVGGEPRNVRLRGLSSEYTAVTLDGVPLASADANAGNRAFGFEQVSLSSMDSIEVSKTISADVDANAPAGTINLRTKNAFDRAGRRISWQANVSGRSSHLRLGKSFGPDETPTRKVRPGGMFEYSDVFFAQRLGVVLNVTQSSIFGGNTRPVFAYNYTPTAADPRPAVPTSLAFNQSFRVTDRFSVTLTSDFKATPDLTLSLRVIYSGSDLWNTQRTVTFNTGARNTVLGDNPLTSFTTSAPNASVVSAPVYISKPGELLTLLPRFEYKRGGLQVEGKFAASDAVSKYDPLSRHGAFFSAGATTLSGVTYRAERSSLISADWKITQLAGPDLSSGAGYTSPTVSVDDGRYSRTQLYTADLFASFRTDRVLPIEWKAGGKSRQEIRNFRQERDAFAYTYTGPGRGVGAWANYRSPFELDLSDSGAAITSASGRNAFVPDLVAMGGLFRNRPQDFTPVATAAGYYNAYIANKRYYQEDINAAFLMGTATRGKSTLRAGLRWEETRSEPTDFDPRSAAEVRAAGFPVDASGRATTVPGIVYQYESKPKITRQGYYDNLFPSASFKHKFSPNLELQLGYSSTIKRPGFSNVAGVWVINDDTLRVTAPNRELPPETSDNYSARLAYYFEPVGLLALNGFQNTVEGLHLSSQLTADQFGYSGDRDLSTYTFVTTISSPDSVTIRGMELEYSQALSFLPQPFKRLTVRASYTRNYADVIIPNMSPHSASAGLSFTHGRFNANANYTWNDDVPFDLIGRVYNRHRSNVDFGGGVRLTRQSSLFFTVRNALDAPWIRMEKVGTNPAVATIPDVWGTQVTLGVKGTF